MTCDVTQYVAVFVIALVQKMLRHARYLYHLSACGTWGEEGAVLTGSEREGERVRQGMKEGGRRVCVRVGEVERVCTRE